MPQSQMARVICSQCNAWYSSEPELRQHMQTAHRKIAEKILPPSPIQADRAKQGCTTSYLTEHENEMDKLCERTPAEKREEYVQPDDEKETGGEA